MLISFIAFAGLIVSCKKENDENTLTLEGHVYDYTTQKPIQGVDLTCDLIEYIPWAIFNYLDEQYETTTKDGKFKFQFSKPGDESYIFSISGPSHPDYICQGTSMWNYEFHGENKKVKIYLNRMGKLPFRLIKQDTTTSKKIVCKINALFEIPFVEPTLGLLPGRNEAVTLRTPEVTVKSGELFWVNAKAYGSSYINLEIFEIINGRRIPKESKNINVNNPQVIKQGITKVELSF
ncbi:MAG TPA: hypothetical protein VK202_08635 [Bacteroidia bacterium]|nr:hypothetical protein [Bacteroidia bacterium]